MGGNLKIAVGSDHGGLDLKNQLLGYLQSRGYFVQDCGTHSKDAVDYPRIAYTVARLVAGGDHGPAEGATDKPVVPGDENPAHVISFSG